MSTPLLLQDARNCMTGEELGSGANGAVQAMSIPVLPGAVFKKAGSQQAIEHEAGILRQVSHPNIVAAYGTMVGPAPSAGSKQHVFLAMERLGTSLQARQQDLT